MYSSAVPLPHFDVLNMESGSRSTIRVSEHVANRGLLEFGPCSTVRGVFEIASLHEKLERKIEPFLPSCKRERR